MGLLINEGKLWLKDGKPLVGDDFGCCCGTACCNGLLLCTSAVGTFQPGIACGGVAHDIQIAWQWTLNFDETCRFFWQINDLDAIGNGVSGFADYANAQCTDCEGVWVPGLAGNHGQFEYNGRPNPTDLCRWTNATVTITKLTNGYQFWVQGVEENDGFLCGDCADTDGTFLVECP